MTRVQPKATPNWCLQVKADEPWTGRCVKEKIADDGKRHRCRKPEKHGDNVRACLPVRCGAEVVLVVKIDTEGSEDKVLAGLSRPIDQFHFEVHAGCWMWPPGRSRDPRSWASTSTG